VSTKFVGPSDQKYIAKSLFRQTSDYYSVRVVSCERNFSLPSSYLYLCLYFDQIEASICRREFARKPGRPYGIAQQMKTKMTMTHLCQDDTAGQVYEMPSESSRRKK
jgi:hypothetical protein